MPNSKNAAVRHKKKADRKMYTHVLYTDGTRIIKLLWVKHRGSDVVYGMYDIEGHSTYHASGQWHDTSDEGHHANLQHQLPLAEIKGMVQLTSLNFRNTSAVFRFPLN